MVTFLVFKQYLFSSFVLLIDDFCSFGIDELRGRLGIRFAKSVLILTGRVVERNILHFIAHTEISNHGISAFSSLLKVAQRAGIEHTHKEFFSGTATHQGANFIQNMLA